MGEEIRDRDVVLAMETTEPVIAEMDNDVALEIDTPNDIEITLEQPEVIVQELSGDSALGIVVGALPTLAKEATLLAKVAELKEALNTIDFTAIEQAIQNVEDVTAREATLIQGIGDIIKAVENIDFTDLENSIAEVKDAVENIELPEIDTSAIAKQGNNPDATLTAIYKLLIGSNEPSSDIPEGVAERLALILEFFGIKPIEAYEFMTAEEVCAELEEIMTSMDLDLTPEKAKEITQQTLNN